MLYCHDGIVWPIVWMLPNTKLFNRPYVQHAQLVAINYFI